MRKYFAGLRDTFAGMAWGAACIAIVSWAVDGSVSPREVAGYAVAWFGIAGLIGICLWATKKPTPTERKEAT